MSRLKAMRLALRLGTKFTILIRLTPIGGRALLVKMLVCFQEILCKKWDKKSPCRLSSNLKQNQLLYLITMLKKVTKYPSERVKSCLLLKKSTKVGLWEKLTTNKECFQYLMVLLSNIVTESLCAKACYDYNAQESNEISFKVGDLITEINKIDEGWWQGSIDDQSGLFPANHVVEL
eukprot:NODE_323_length_9725_cov_0.840536.p7 type:complete len:177 gc:universal NODE_323_length_9725_cov_0.840536:6024-5494(-)